MRPKSIAANSQYLALANLGWRTTYSPGTYRGLWTVSWFTPPDRHQPIRENESGYDDLIAGPILMFALCLHFTVLRSQVSPRTEPNPACLQGFP
jgi:hypothetical protein